jgi:anti-sigma regulatory factor (Ser/Thr protein kinase)
MDVRAVRDGPSRGANSHAAPVPRTGQETAQVSGSAFPHPSPRIPTDIGDRYELRLPPDPTSAAKARAFVVEHCVPDGTVRDAAKLLVSELVTNVVLHARTPMTVGVASTPEAVLVTVTDADDTVPPVAGAREAPRDMSAEGGRGLALLRLLSTECGVTSHETGKTVWTLVRATAR